MPSFRNLTGMKFGKLTVLNRADDYIQPNGRRRSRWHCICECGKEAFVISDALTTGKQISCGCYRKAHASEMFSSHKKTNTRLYGVWSAMKSRCSNPNVFEYRYYGARGIQVCEDWAKSFDVFYNWAVSSGYDEKAKRGVCTIDRIDFDGDYEPSNCRIVSQAKQMNNIHTNHILEYNGEKHTIAEWSRITGIDQFKIRNRVSKLGWTEERALTTI